MLGSRQSRRKTGIVLTRYLLAASLVTAACGSATTTKARARPVTISWTGGATPPEGRALPQSGWTASRVAEPRHQDQVGVPAWDAYWDKVEEDHHRGGNAYDVVASLCSCFAASYFDDESSPTFKKIDGYSGAVNGAQPGPSRRLG